MPNTDPFNILGEEPEVPPSFDEAVRAAVTRLQEAAERFEPLYDETPEEWLSEQEWQIIERSAEELVEAIEKAEDAYVAVMYDSHAWYRILENLEAVRLRLESAAGILRSARDRHAGSG